jgi:hypothetical protein
MTHLEVVNITNNEIQTYISLLYKAEFGNLFTKKVILQQMTFTFSWLNLTN